MNMKALTTLLVFALCSLLAASIYFAVTVRDLKRQLGEAKIDAIAQRIDDLKATIEARRDTLKAVTNEYNFITQEAHNADTLIQRTGNVDSLIALYYRYRPDLP